MSFIKKAVKKVFSVAKKIVKSKVFKWIAIAALCFFTAGVAAGGFAAFAGVNSIGSFFVAVGQTMATGAASMASSLGFQGMSSSLAAHGGAAAIQAGLTTTATSATGATLTATTAGSNATTGIIAAEGGTNAAATSGGILTNRAGEAVALSSKGAAAANAARTAAQVQSLTTSYQGMGMSQVAAKQAAEATVFGMQGGGAVTTASNWELMMNGLYSNAPKGITGGMSTTAKTVLLSGLVTGAQSMLASKAAQNRFPNSFVAGGLARGGGTKVSVPHISFGEPAATGTEAGAPDTAIAQNEPIRSHATYRMPDGAPQDAQTEEDQGPMSRFDVAAPAELPPFSQFAEEAPKPQDALAAAQTQEGIGIFDRANQPVFQNTNTFFGRFPQATPLESPSGSRNTDRYFGNSILGVG